jgi:hypothetical protein
MPGAPENPANALFVDEFLPTQVATRPSFGQMALCHAYIERSPVKAGLVDSADKYHWSSAGKSVETSLDAADTSVRATQAGLDGRLS